MASIDSAPPASSVREIGDALSRVLTEAAAARRMRGIEQLSAQAVAARRSGGDAAATVARSAYAIVRLERLIADDTDRPADLCRFLNRVGTLVQLALPCGSDLATHFAPVAMPGAVARALVAALLELLHVASSAALNCRPQLYMGSFVKNGEFAVAVGGGALAAAHGASAARCIDLARRIAKLLGGRFCRGSDRGMHVALIVLPMPNGTETCLA